MIDYHIHLEKGKYAKDWLEEFLTVGRERGITEFCFTEHLHRFKASLPLLSRVFSHTKKNKESEFMGEWWKKYATEDVEKYISFIQGLKREDYLIKLGCEIDYFEGEEEWLTKFIKDHPWDFVIGSIHWLKGWGFDHLQRPEGWIGKDVDQVYQQYFLLLQRMVSSNLFDIIGHLDVIKVFGFKPKNFDLHTVEEIIKIMSDKRIGTELNTAGLRKPAKEIYPSKEILQLCQKHNIFLTLGSDAHHPQEVGQDFEKALNLLREVGYSQLSVFEERRRKEIKLQ
ncbi:MAG: histidinol-phosphatase HisJ family protein [Candidatus Edwardsbacteria bacterium]